MISRSLADEASATQLVSTEWGNDRKTRGFPRSFLLQSEIDLPGSFEMHTPHFLTD